MSVGLQGYLLVGAALFSLGIYTICTRRNAVAVLMGIELVLNSAGVNLVAFSRFSAGDLHGQVFTLFVICLAAAEATVALAIVVGIYVNFHTTQADEADLLRQ